LRLIFGIGENAACFLIIDPFSLTIFGRQHGLLPDEEQVKRAIRFLCLLNAEVQGPADSPDGTEDRRAGSLADGRKERELSLRALFSIGDRELLLFLLRPLCHETAKNQPKDKNRCRKEAGVRFVDKERNFYGSHH